MADLATIVDGIQTLSPSHGTWQILFVYSVGKSYFFPPTSLLLSYPVSFFSMLTSPLRRWTPLPNLDLGFVYLSADTMRLPDGWMFNEIGRKQSGRPGGWFSSLKKEERGSPWPLCQTCVSSVGCSHTKVKSLKSGVLRVALNTETPGNAEWLNQSRTHLPPDLGI